MNEGILADFLVSLKDEAEQHGEFLVQGKCSDFAMYKHRVGLIQGLKQAEQLLHDTVRLASDEFQDYEDEDSN